MRESEGDEGAEGGENYFVFNLYIGSIIYILQVNRAPIFKFIRYHNNRLVQKSSGPKFTCM